MHFGSVPFRFEGGAGPLYAPFTLLWLCYVTFFSAFIVIWVAAIRAQLQRGQPIPQGQVPLHWADIPHSPVWIMLALIPLALIGLSWFEARKLNVFARATKIGTIDTDLQATGGSVLWLTVSNLFILILSLGILRPITQARRLRYLVTRMSFLGSADLDEVSRGVEQEGSQGAGLEAAFSIEIF